MFQKKNPYRPPSFEKLYFRKLEKKLANFLLKWSLNQHYGVPQASCGVEHSSNALAKKVKKLIVTL